MFTAFQQILSFRLQISDEFRISVIYFEKISLGRRVGGFACEYIMQFSCAVNQLQLQLNLGKSSISGPSTLFQLCLITMASISKLKIYMYTHIYAHISIYSKVLFSLYCTFACSHYPQYQKSQLRTSWVLVIISIFILMWCFCFIFMVFLK